MKMARLRTEGNAIIGAPGDFGSDERIHQREDRRQLE
jgi:hypothetical protein